MTVIGFHASHEQVHPAALLDAVRAAEEAGFTAAMSSDHFSPWSERQGHSGFAWSWLGAAMATTSLPFGIVNAPGQRYHPAIVAQAAATLSAHVPRPAVGRARHRRGVERAHHRRPLAAQARPQRPPAASAWTSSAGLHAGEEVTPRRAGAGRPGPHLDPARRAAGADRRGGVARDRGVGGRLGRRPGHRQPAARAAAGGGRRLPRRGRHRAGRAAGPPVVRGRRRHGAAASPGTSGAPTCSARRCAGTSRWSSTSTRSASGSGPRTCASSVLVSERSRAARSLDPRSGPSSASTPCTCTTSARSSRSSSTCSVRRSSRSSR